MLLSVLLTVFSAMGWVDVGVGHIKLALLTFVYCIFSQAFVMFYFIGVSRLVDNIWVVLNSGENLEKLFSQPPGDAAPYIKKTKKFVQESTRYKRQTIPWVMLILVLGMLAFLMGGAHDTGMVEKSTHLGLVYGFVATSCIGFFRQWNYLGKAHLLLRRVKTLFQIPDAQM